MPETYTAKRVCQYCNEVYGETPGFAIPATETHGICPNCFPGAIKAVERGENYQKTPPFWMCPVCRNQGYTDHRNTYGQGRKCDKCGFVEPMMEGTDDGQA